jgi:hypothetical protein
MKLGIVLRIVLLVAIALPFAVIARAVSSCCFGTTCPQRDNCDLTLGTPGPYNCKRMCGPDCTETQGCCQYKIQDCSYGGGLCMSITPGQQIVAVTYGANTFCRNGGNEVACLATNIASCAP